MKTKRVLAADDYLRLVQHFPLTAIRDEKHAEAAWKIIEPLAVKGEDSDGRSRLTRGEADYLYAMSDLIEVYEQKRSVPESLSTLESLKFLMGEHNMSSSDLGRLLGNRSLGTNILTGKRELSKAHIRILAEHFKVSPALFL